MRYDENYVIYFRHKQGCLMTQLIIKLMIYNIRLAIESHFDLG